MRGNFLSNLTRVVWAACGLAGWVKGKGLEVKLKLSHLTDEQHHILKLVVEEYYAVLPEALKVHSLFATHILSQTLHHFGIRTRLLPCRLWCSRSQSDKGFPGGFVNFYNVENWNGHVVCLVGEWLIDAALYHLNPTFNFEVPKIIARRIALPEPDIYARYRLNSATEFVWYRLPPKAAPVSVTGYEDFIGRFVSMLVAHINSLLGIVKDPDAAEGVPDEQALLEAQDAPEGELVTPEEQPVLEGQIFDGDTAELAGEVAGDEIVATELDSAGEPVPVIEAEAQAAKAETV